MKTGSKPLTISSLQAHNRLVANAPDVISLLDRGLARTEEGCSQISLNCYQVNFPPQCIPVVTGTDLA